MMFGVALEVLRKEYKCRIATHCPDSVPVNSCNGCEFYTDSNNVTEALKTVLDAFGNGSEIPNSSGDLIDRAEAQTELQFAARRYTVAKEAHGEGQVVWSDNLISVTDAMNALRKVPPVQDKQNFPLLMSGTLEDLVSSSYLLAEYERQHEGPPDGARKIIEEAPPVPTSVSQTKFKPGSKFLLEIGEKRIGLDEYNIVGTDLYVWESLLEKLTPYEPVDDMISRQAAINALNVEGLTITGETSAKAVYNYIFMVIGKLKSLPSVQAEQKITHCENCKHKHLEKDVWTCPYGLPGGPKFFCGYGGDVNE